MERRGEPGQGPHHSGQIPKPGIKEGHPGVSGKVPRAEMREKGPKREIRGEGLKGQNKERVEMKGKGLTSGGKKEISRERKNVNMQSKQRGSAQAGAKRSGGREKAGAPRKR